MRSVGKSKAATACRLGRHRIHQKERDPAKIHAGDSCRVFRMMLFSYSVAFFLALLSGSFIGCDGVEARRRATLQRMQFSSGRPEDQHVRKLIVSALRQATPTTLGQPQIVYATAVGISQEPKKGTVQIDWIAAEPLADTVRFVCSDGREVDVSIPKLDQDMNAAFASEGLVLFTVVLFVGQREPDLWLTIAEDAHVRIALVHAEEAVSQPFHLRMDWRNARGHTGS